MKPAIRLCGFARLAALLALLLLFGWDSQASADLEEPADQSSQAVIQPRISLPLTLANYDTTWSDPCTNCRYGLAAWPSQINWLPNLGAGWYLDFSTHAPGRSPAEFVQQIRVRQKKDGCTYLDSFAVYPPLTSQGLGAQLKATPGALWIVGNEPDRGPDPGNCIGPGQDDTYPQIYARVYHDVYAFIKQNDPTAQVAIAGLVQITPGRLQYLDIVWNAYLETYGQPIPVDVWNMHLYVLPEAQPDGQPNGVANIALGTDPSLAIRESAGDPKRCADPNVYCWAEHDSMDAFREQIVAMRRWLKAHNQQAKPLILSEYSLLYPYEIEPDNPAQCFLQDENGQCFTPERVDNFLRNSAAYLESARDPELGYSADGYRLVQQWLWYSSYTSGAGAVSNVLTRDLWNLTSVGRTYRELARREPPTINLAVISEGATHSVLPSGAATMDVSLPVTFVNNGNRNTDTPFVVSFYADQNRTQLIASVTVTQPVAGCVRNPLTVSATWPDRQAGSYHYWVRVDSAGAIPESIEADNDSSGIAVIIESSIQLPLLLRT